LVFVMLALGACAPAGSARLALEPGRGVEQHDRELAKLFAASREFATRDVAIPAKYKVLITLLSDAIQGHPDGVRAVAQRARAMGVSETEICETLRVAYDCGGTPALIIGLNAFRE
jgi:alkylhydroperoxidase/carboxymuconolactone decarboxylase family protein YurZ